MFVNSITVCVCVLCVYCTADRRRCQSQSVRVEEIIPGKDHCTCRSDAVNLNDVHLGDDFYPLLFWVKITVLINILYSIFK